MSEAVYDWLIASFERAGGSPARAILAAARLRAGRD
jgi:hypothetical protein